MMSRLPDVLFGIGIGLLWGAGIALLFRAVRPINLTFCLGCDAMVRCGDTVLRAYRKDFDNSIVCLECEHGARIQRVQAARAGGNA